MSEMAHYASLNLTDQFILGFAYTYSLTIAEPSRVTIV
jgi:hypothetical protein